MNYRILPYADGWAVGYLTEMHGPYRSVELACAVALGLLRLGQMRGEKPKLLFHNGEGDVSVLWPKEASRPHLVFANPWGGLSPVMVH